MKFDNPVILEDLNPLNDIMKNTDSTFNTATIEDVLKIDYDGTETDEQEEGEFSGELTDEELLAKVDQKDTKDPKDSKKSTNSAGTSTDNSLSEIAPAVAQLLADEGFFVELPEGVDEENFDEDALLNTFKHNLKIAETKSFEEGVNYERSRFLDNLPEIGVRVFEFLDHPNLDEDDLKSYLRSVLFENDITRLDPDDSYDAEKIVRAFYSFDKRFTQEEIDTKIEDLITSDKIKKEASILKPKVDMQASKAAQEQADLKKRIQEQERAYQNHLITRTKDMLTKGKLNGVDLTREDAELAFKLIVNNDIPVPVKGGKSVEMGFAELEIFKHKYTQEGNLENLALGLLIMAKGPEVIERYFSKKATTKATAEFIKENKFNFQKKSGGSGAGVPNTQAGKRAAADFKFRGI